MSKMGRYVLEKQTREENLNYIKTKPPRNKGIKNLINKLGEWVYSYKIRIFKHKKKY